MLYLSNCIFKCIFKTAKLDPDKQYMHLKKNISMILLVQFMCKTPVSMEHSRERERNVLFNDALNTFYLRLYGVRHMVKDHSDSEKGNPLLPHRLLLSINSKGSFICTIPQTG